MPASSLKQWLKLARLQSGAATAITPVFGAALLMSEDGLDITHLIILFLIGLLFHFFGFLRDLGATTFLISEIPMGSDRLVAYQEDFLSDGILYLRQYEVGETDVQLRLRCVKMRRTNHDRGYFTLMRANENFSVTSVITE